MASLLAQEGYQIEALVEGVSDFGDDDSPTATRCSCT
jgi:hypothetical protein